MKRLLGQWAPWISNPGSSEDPAQLQLPTSEQMREEMINELLRDHPTLSREEAEEEVDAFL